MKQFLSEKLPVAWKLGLRRAAYVTVAWALRASVRAREFVERLREGAAANGFDVGHASDADSRRRAPGVEPFGAADFLLLAHAARAREDEGVAYGGDGPDAAHALKTSIVVPVVGDVELTFQCLRSLAREVDLTKAEVIIVNNSPDDLTRELLSRFRGLVRVIDGGANGGDDSGEPNREFPDLWKRFIEACNRGAAEARGRQLVFLGGNASVGRGWLGELTETLERESGAGAAGSLSLDARERVGEAGGVVWSDGEADAYGRGWSAEDRRVAFAREVDYCSAASLAVRRDLFERLGGFDVSYASAEYAAASLCMGVRSLGRKVVYQPASRVTHMEDARGVSARVRAADRERFRDEWRATLEREHVAHATSDLERAANRRWATQVAVFDDLIPTPDRDAGSARMMHILRALDEWAHVVFIPTGKLRRPEYERLLWREGIETASAPDYKRLLRQRNFRAAVLSRPEVAAVMLALVRRAAPGLKVVYDMLDVHHLRATREAALTGDARAAQEAETYRRIETETARAVDLIWCGSSPDKEIMARIAPGVPSVAVPTIHELRDPGPPFERREHLVFVGSFAHRPNVDAVHFLACEVMPLVRESVAGVELLVVGGGAPPEFAEYAPHGVRVLGYVPDLDPVMYGCRVFVAPIRFGSGVNGKIGEALSYGLPLVTTNVGAEGWGFTSGEQVLIADSAADFAASVVRLYGDAALWRKLADAGHRHIAQNFTPEVIGGIINESLGARSDARTKIK